MKTRAVLAVLVLAGGLLALVASPAGATTNVNVHFELSNVAPTPLGTGPNTTKACDVSVLAGADGVAVLDAAVASGCIASYHVIWFGTEAFVDCINGTCSTFPVQDWGMYVDEHLTSYGASDYRAVDGDELEFSYQLEAFFFGP